MTNIIEIVLPTFIVIAIGYALGKLTRLNLTAVVDIALYIGVPALIFTSLLNKEIILRDATGVWAASLAITFGCGIAAWLVFSILRQRHSGLYVPISMMNTMNIPFPVVYLAYGAEGLVAATLFYIPNALLISTLGIYILAGKRWRGNLKEVFKVPIFYASLLGLILNLLHVNVPGLVIKSLDLIAMMALPLVLLVLGYNLSQVRMTSFPTTLLASFLRMGVGLIVGLLVVNILDITGIYRSVVILVSAMPAAAMSSILATKYGNEAELVSSVVFLTTIVSLVTIPFLLYILA